MYNYKSLSIPGGGFVSGILYHKTEKNLCYIRTDIGGAYRLGADGETWSCLALKAGIDRLCLTSPLSLALDDNDPEKLYMVCGTGESGFLAVSGDRGESFALKPLPVAVNGNGRGRSSGERLIKHGGKLFFASQGAGLLLSGDEGESWEKADAFGCTDCSFVSAFGEITVLGTSDGESLLSVSFDRGKSFARLAVPDGFVPVRCAFDGAFLYVCANRRAENGFFTCEAAHITEGKLLRFELIKGDFKPFTDITPDVDFLKDARFALGGIACAADGFTALSTVSCSKGDVILGSDDHGESWRVIIHRGDLSLFSCSTPYMKPEFNGGTTMLHWISDIALDPFSGAALFNTGTGVFRAGDLRLSGSYRDFCRGIEETVHMNVYAPPSGEFKVLDAVGDLGGFAFSEAEAFGKGFLDENNNRYITILNIDFPDADPSVVAATPRGNWTGLTKGGVIISRDGGLTWKHTSQPRGLSARIDSLIRRIERPNENAGFVAVSADGKTLVQTLCDGQYLPSDAVAYSSDGGESWSRSAVYDLAGNPVGGERRLRAYADRLNPALFYGLGENGRLYFSSDNGKSFREALSGLPAEADFSAPFGSETRAEPGRSGVLWAALRRLGLWRLEFIPAENRFEARRVTAANDVIYTVGIGKALPGSGRLTLYISGTIGGKYGFWRSRDGGNDWELISRELLFGRINSLCGDMRVPGRFYIGSGTFGLIEANTDEF